MAGKTAVLSVRIIGDAQQATKAYKDAEGAAEKFGAKMSKIDQGMELTGKLAGLGAGAALTEGFMDAVDADKGTRKLAGQLGLTAEESKQAGDLAGKLYGEAYGGSLEEVNEAISAVASGLTDFATGGAAEVENLTRKAMDLSSTFDVGVSEAVNTAGILLKTGLAKNGDEAFDLLVGSMQKMPKAMQAELLPVMDEYSKDFQALGIDGRTAFGIITQAAQGGAIMMDKSGDALKEFLILGTTGGKPVEDAFKSIGMSWEDTAGKLAAGGDGAADAFARTVAGLQGITDPAAQAQAAIALFGTPLEDLGANKVPEFLGAIDPMGDSFDSLKGKADELGKTVGEGPGVAIEKFSRDAQLQLQEFAAQAIPYLQPVLDKAAEYSWLLGPLAGLIAAVAAAQLLWNAAMALNPIGIIIIAIAAVTAGIIWAYENVGWFRDGIDRLGAAAGPVFDAIGKAVDNVIQWLDDVLEPVGGIEGALQIMGTTAGIIFGQIIDNIIGMIDWIKKGIDWFNSLFGAKQAANSGPVGNADGGAMPLMAQPLMGVQSFTAQPLVGAQSLTGTASLASTSASLGSLSSGGLKVGGGTTINLTVKADATTDGVQLGKQLVRTINKALTAQGSPKLASI